MIEAKAEKKIMLNHREEELSGKEKRGGGKIARISQIKTEGEEGIRLEKDGERSCRARRKKPRRRKGDLFAGRK